MKYETVKAAKDLVETAIGDLAPETDAFQQSARWKSMLNTMSRFHKYSIANQFLIMSQRESATHVAGFHAWKSLGRHVIKGAKGIAIMVPCKVKGKSEIAGGQAQVSAEAVGEIPSKGEGDSFVVFRTGYVFDFSDTEGRPLDLIELPPVLDDNGNLPLVEAAVKSLGIEITYEEFSQSGLNGVSKGGHIAVRGSLPAGDKTSVFIHECAHELLHWGANRERAKKIGKETVEIEAESTAYVVMRYLGIKSTADLYLTSYGADGAAIKAAIDRVREASSRIISAIDQVRKAQSLGAADDTPLPLAA